MTSNEYRVELLRRIRKERIKGMLATDPEAIQRHKTNAKKYEALANRIGKICGGVEYAMVKQGEYFS